MRRHGVVDSAAGLDPFGHLGWGYRDRDEFLARAAEYIVDGLRQNHYIAYAGERTREGLRSELAAMPGVGGYLDTGAVAAIPAEEFYIYGPGPSVIDADAAVAKYLAAVEQAIANGYSGFRAVSDVTPVARTPEQRNALTRLEFLVDQQMAVLPFSALCGYDMGALGVVANELVCLHPFVSAGSVPFQLYADPDADSDFALTGELDASAAEVFGAALQRVWPLISRRTVHMGAQELEFIDHQQLHRLDERARAHNCEVVISTNQPTVRRLVDLLELTHVRVQ